ncbi:MAG TPA: 4Fe-4S dicluster domain-containing protein [Candidatus Binatus sp.]|nr:4Fe-4S dicluster domain-containing protein [Candidatus Binatus sp.]
MLPVQAVARQPATVTIDVETCKGCVLCVDVCPPHVLVMSEDVNRMGYRYPILLDGCTGCELCFKICPDYCFEVYRGAEDAAPLAN